MNRNPDHLDGHPLDGESQVPLTHEQLVLLFTTMGWSRARIEDFFAGRTNDAPFDFVDARALYRLDDEGGAIR